jgi:hypothetical protein
VDRGRKVAGARHAGAPVTAALVRWLGRRFPLPVYVGSILLLTALITAVVVWLAARYGARAPSLIGIGVLASVCASQLAVAIVHRVVMMVVRPRVLPRMDFSKGIPPEHRTAVVVPAMLTDDASVDELLEALEVRFLANRDENLSFALLTDFRDAPEESAPSDAPLLERAKKGIIALNARYGAHAAGARRERRRGESGPRRRQRR